MHEAISLIGIEDLFIFLNKKWSLKEEGHRLSKSLLLLLFLSVSSSN